MSERAYVASLASLESGFPCTCTFMYCCLSCVTGKAFVRLPITKDAVNGRLFGNAILFVPSNCI